MVHSFNMCRILCAIVLRRERFKRRGKHTQRKRMHHLGKQIRLDRLRLWIMLSLLLCIFFLLGDVGGLVHNQQTF